MQAPRNRLDETLKKWWIKWSCKIFTDQKGKVVSFSSFKGRRTHAPGDGVTTRVPCWARKDDQENWIRIAERLHICQLSWLNTAVEEKNPVCFHSEAKLCWNRWSSSAACARSFTWGIYGCIRKCFLGQLFPFLGSHFPSSLLSHLDTHQLLVYLSFCPLLLSSVVWNRDTRAMNVLNGKVYVFI